MTRPRTRSDPDRPRHLHANDRFRRRLPVSRARSGGPYGTALSVFDGTTERHMEPVHRRRCRRRCRGSRGLDAGHRDDGGDDMQRVAGDDRQDRDNTGGLTTGTAGNDVIVTGNGNDTIKGLGGNDAICSRGGNDSIDAGVGDDYVFSGGGTTPSAAQPATTSSWAASATTPSTAAPAMTPCAASTATTSSTAARRRHRIGGGGERLHGGNAGAPTPARRLQRRTPGPHADRPRHHQQRM